MPPYRNCTTSFFHIFLFVLLLAAAVHISGGISLGQSFVTGRVIDERSFPVPYAKLILNGNEVTADVTGRFLVTNTGIPYNVIVAERNTSSAVFYKDLTVTNPDLVLFGDPDPRNYSRAVVKVEFPPLADTSEAYVSFISREMIYCNTVVGRSGKDNVTLTVDFPFAYSNVTGDVVMIRKNPSGYQFFRKKSVTITRNPARNRVILPAKPESSTGIKSVKLFSGIADYYQGEISMSLDFLDYSKNSQLTILEVDGKKQKNVIDLPSKLPNTVRLRVNTFADTRSGSKFSSYYYTSPGQDLKVTEEFLPELVVPSDGYLGVNAATEFRYTVGSGAGIYVLEFRSRNPDMKYFVVTNETAGRFSLLSRQEFTNYGNVTFSWRVRKYLTYFTVDEFIRPNIFKNEIGYKGVLYSNGRSFRTGYF
ncbi:MAG: hypothetical protein K1X85_01175 [Ignavibacteria bacterium]|nr:hypothetical protein [Ignavibacteria bacterium]